jgi:acyl carrier protein
MREKYMSTTLERLSAILIKDYKVSPELLQIDTPLEVLGIDSLGMAELLFFIEDEFKLKLPIDPVELLTIKDVVYYVDKLVVAQHESGTKETVVVMSNLRAS